jgi:hypothetical protein
MITIVLRRTESQISCANDREGYRENEETRESKATDCSRS